MQPCLQRFLNPFLLLLTFQITCVLGTGGPGGGSQSVTALCLLPLNVIQDKVFLTLWFLLALLSVVNLASMAYRAVMVSSAIYR